MGDALLEPVSRGKPSFLNQTLPARIGNGDIIYNFNNFAHDNSCIEAIVSKISDGLLNLI